MPSYQGLLNTLRISVVGIVAATILGTLVGIGRLSSNWIVSKLATVYVEAVRNVPLAFFVIAGCSSWSSVCSPDPDAWQIGGLAIISNRGCRGPVVSVRRWASAHRHRSDRRSSPGRVADGDRGVGPDRRAAADGPVGRRVRSSSCSCSDGSCSGTSRRCPRLDGRATTGGIGSTHRSSHCSSPS